MAVVLVGLASVGCGGPTAELAEVRGRVEYDGALLPEHDHAAVVLQPQSGRLAKGVIASDGTFQLSTYRAGDGAVVGAAKITVNATVDEKGPKVDRYAGLRWVIPKKFGDADSSGLTCDVIPDEENIFRIVLRSDGTGEVEKVSLRHPQQ
jgi:hypothetical protein